MDKQVAQWLGDYVVMMEANLGTLQNSKIPGLYDSIVERVVDIRMRLKVEGYNMESPSQRTSGAHVTDTMNCPKCNMEWDDCDGFGVLYCSPSWGGCGYCKHASILDGICQFCEKPVERGSTVGGSHS